MRSRKWRAVLGGGAAFVVLSALNLFTPLGDSLLLGLGIGMLVVAPAGEAVVGSGNQNKTVVMAPLPVRLKGLVETRRRRETEEHERVLESFDDAIEKVGSTRDSDTIRTVDSRFGSLVEDLTRHYPEWDGEGRMRTYVLMNNLSRSLTPQNAEAYLDLAYRTLQARGSEASDLSRMTLNGKVERLYWNYEGELAKHIAGTLLLMHRGEEYFAREMVVEALHLWNDARFARLKADFEAIPMLGLKEEQIVIELLQKEIRKARKVKDRKTVVRAKDLISTITAADRSLKSTD